MRRRLNPLGLKRLANFTADDAAKGARASTIRQLQRDIPQYLRYQNLIETRKARNGVAQIVINRSNRRIAALLSLEISGGRVRVPSKDIRHWMRIVDRRYSAKRIYQLTQAAYNGFLESQSNTSEKKVYVSHAINDKHYALVFASNGTTVLYERYGRPYSTVRAPSTGGTRGQRQSRVIAFYPDELIFKPRWKFQQAIDRHMRRNGQQILNRQFKRVLRNRNYRAGQRR